MLIRRPPTPLFEVSSSAMLRIQNFLRKFLYSAVVVVLLSSFSTPAWARSYHIAKFNSTIHVDEDGSARISEQITFAFSGSFQGVYRNIPVEYPGPGGSNYSLFLTLGHI